jgi:ribosomal protein S18 acetylase RimI-like enzyme
MTTEPSIRRAHATDLAAVYAGEIAYIREVEPLQEARWKNAIPQHLLQWTAALDRTFIVEVAGEIIGHCFWDVAGGNAELASIYVGPAHRRRGIGRQLVALFLEDAKAGGMAMATLGVRPDNPARHLYEGLGFARMHDMDGYRRYSLALTAPSPGANDNRA